MLSVIMHFMYPVGWTKIEQIFKYIEFCSNVSQNIKCLGGNFKTNAVNTCLVLHV
jgi:hypothetical protein